jgi:hypothetical protein
MVDITSEVGVFTLCVCIANSRRLASGASNALRYPFLFICFPSQLSIRSVLKDIHNPDLAVILIIPMCHL